MKHQLIFQAVWLTTVFAAYMLLNCLLSVCLACCGDGWTTPFLTPSRPS